jgi:AcrR family transcriptional regulator
MTVTSAGHIPVESMTQAQLAKRRLILEAVIRLIDEEGPDRVTVKAVAVESQIALATIYRFFTSKEHLFAAALVHWGSPLATVARRADSTDLPVPQQLSLLVRQGTRAYQRHPNLLALLMQSSISTDPFVRDIMAELGIITRSALAAKLPPMPADDAMLLTEIIAAVWAEVLGAWHTGRRPLTEGLARADLIIEVGMAGITARSESRR